MIGSAPDFPKLFPKTARCSAAGPPRDYDERRSCSGNHAHHPRMYRRGPPPAAAAEIGAQTSRRNGEAKGGSEGGAKRASANGAVSALAASRLLSTIRGGGAMLRSRPKLTAWWNLHIGLSQPDLCIAPRGNALRERAAGRERGHVMHDRPLNRLSNASIQLRLRLSRCVE